MKHYTKVAPFKALLKQRIFLNKEGSVKKTYHLVLDIKGSNIEYKPGDSIAVIPSNNPAIVSQCLMYLKCQKDDLIHFSRTKENFPITEFLLNKANITKISAKVLCFLCEKEQNEDKKKNLTSLLLPKNRLALNDYLHTHELWDILKEHQSANFTAQEICSLLPPLIPRLYSIASSYKANPDEMHLIVGLVFYKTSDIDRFGVCSHYLCELAPVGSSIPIYLSHAHEFFLNAEKNKDIVMIGLGTGVAPFRAFMQERIFSKASGRNWLFFGECNKALDFYYEDYWNELVNQNLLRIDTAFSRDQKEKIYIQQRIYENGKDLFDWINNGANIYICGSAQKMAKDVDLALETIIEKEGHMSKEKAHEYLQNLRQDNRYLRDVY